VRVLVNSQALAPLGGVEVSTLQVSRELARRDHDLAVLYLDGGPLEGEWRRLAGDIRRVPSFSWTKRHPVRDLRALMPAIRAAAAIRPDVVYLNRVEQLVWGLLASRAAGAPLVCHLRHHPDFPAVRLAGRGVARFIAVSSYVKSLWVEAGLRKEWVEVVPNGVDPRDYPAGGAQESATARAALDLPADAFIVVSYGRIHPDKGVDTLLDAWQRLGAPPGEATLLVAGDPYPTAEGRAHAAALRRAAPPGVRFLPMQADVVPLLHAADVVVLPARWQEPFGRVVAEGLMSGRPVVATAVGGVPEQLTGDLASLLVDPEAPEGQAAALASRLAGLRRWRRADPGLGHRCARHARDRLSLAATVDGVEAVLRAARGGAFARRGAGQVRTGDAWSAGIGTGANGRSQWPSRGL